MAKSPFDRNTRYVLRHLRLGWWTVLVFLSLGIALEVLHAYKGGGYLDDSDSTRRVMWTLAHAYGTLLGLVHIAFAVTLQLLPAENIRLQRYASPCLLGASILLPGGFLLGGVIIRAGNPGLGILLVPVGAAFLFFAVLLTVLGVRFASAGRGG